MSIIVEIIEGPGAGRVHAFDDSVELIEIGRDPAHCRVLFPSDFTAVGRRHLAIRNNAGHYDLETNLRNPVLIDGREPFDGESLGTFHRLQLGTRGPLIEVRISLDGSLPATDPAPVSVSASEKHGRQTRKLSFVASTLGAFLVIGAVVFGYDFWRLHIHRAQLAELSQKINTANRVEVMPAEVLGKVARSVYLVLIARDDGAETPIGTAWVYKPDMLATNSHVADTFNGLLPGQRLIARSTIAPYPSIDIDSVMLHPDYVRFTRLWQTRDPMRGDAKDHTMEMNAPGAGYDVALMQVAGASVLQPPLETASPEILADLQPGLAVGYSGFPMEGLAAGGINPKAPVPQIQMGHITALTDYFLLPGVMAERLLVQHSIPATGGASGSPMVNKDGRVVGLISGINIVTSGTGARAPNAAAINFAQRADLLREAEKGIDSNVAERRMISWEEGFATFDDPVSLVPRNLYRQWLAGNQETTATEIFSKAGILESTEEQNLYAARFRSLVGQAGRYLILAISPSRKDIDITIARGSEPVDKDTSDDWFPYVTLDLEADDDLDVVILASNPEEAPDYRLTVWKLPPASQ